MNIVTRFAPSPTGFLHAGNYRTALFSYIYAHQNGGKFILRIEDSDRNRSKKEYEENIIESLKWLGLSYDDFYRQSDRSDRHREILQKLINDGFAYVSKEIPKEEGDRTEVIRFRNPNKKVSFNDVIRGKIEFDTTEQGDFVIARSMTEPVFHLAVVVDDNDMGVTHVIRGEDHISNTARHILIYEALKFPVPTYAHLPLLMSPDRSKLSKRKGALPMTAYRDKGFIPEALINYMALLGWHPADDREVLPLDEIIKTFSLDRVQKSSAIFDDNKLLWFNREYLLKLSDEQFTVGAKPFLPEWLDTNRSAFKTMLPLIRDKIHVFGDIANLFSSEGELQFAKGQPEYDTKLVLWKKEPDPLVAKNHLMKTREFLCNIPPDSFTSETVKNAIWPYADANGKGNVLWPLRVALTGQEKSPDPFTSAAILGKDETLARIDYACKYL